jgi:hypothetical protein
MDSQKILIGELLMIAFGIGAFIAGVIGFFLWVEGGFTWLWYARAIFAFGLLILAGEGMVLPRVLRTSPIRGPLNSLRRQDRMPTCSFALLLGLIAFGLLACGGVMNLMVQK